MTDLVERLRAIGAELPMSNIEEEAADRIEKLERIAEAARDCGDREHPLNQHVLDPNASPMVTANIPAGLWNEVLAALEADDG